MKQTLVPGLFVALALLLVGCGETLSAEDKLAYKLAGDWHNASNATSPGSIGFSGEKKYIYYNRAGTRVSWGDVRLRVAGSGQFRIEYVPTEGQSIRPDVGRFLSDRVMELTADSAGASPRTLAKRA